jgi:hypothetical protein
VIVKARLTMQRALPVPIEGRGADAALRDGFPATRQVFGGAHIDLTRRSLLMQHMAGLARRLGAWRASALSAPRDWC